MPKINLLYVITKLELGGAQKQLLSLITNLDKKTYNIFLFTSQSGLLLADALSINGLTIKTSTFLERPINPLKDFLALFEIYGFIKKNKIDVVHTHSSKAGILGRLAARLAKIKIILHTVHGWSFNDYQPYLLRKFFVWLERITAQFTHKLIAVSNYDKQKGLKHHIGKEHKYHLIRYGIDYAEFNKNDPNLREELGIDACDLVVAMVSCFKPQKAPQDFIKLAFLVTRTLSNVKFLLIGDGILRKKVEKLIRKLNLEQNVILTGWRRDIAHILRAIDVFVLTSLWEGLPICVLEAMSASLPVVATDTGSITEVIIEGKTGYLAPCHNPKKMSEKLILLLKDKNLRKQIGGNAKNLLDFNYSQHNLLKKTQDLYENLI